MDGAPVSKARLEALEAVALTGHKWRQARIAHDRREGTIEALYEARLEHMMALTELHNVEEADNIENCMLKAVG